MLTLNLNLKPNLNPQEVAEKWRQILENEPRMSHFFIIDGAEKSRPTFFHLTDFSTDFPFESDTGFLLACRELGAEISKPALLEAMATELFYKAKGVMRADWDGFHYLVFVLEAPPKDGRFMLAIFDCDEKGNVVNWSHFFRLHGRDLALSLAKARLMLANGFLIHQPAELLINDLHRYPAFEQPLH